MINQSLLQYRETVRHLFNTSILPLIEKQDDFNDKWDIIDDFSHVEAILFNNMIIKPFNIGGNLSKPIEKLLIKPTYGDAQILIGNPKGDNNRYWDYPLNQINENDIKLCFIDFYDFDMTSFRDYHYYRSKIIDCKDSQVIGREALCEVEYYNAYT